MEYTMKNRRQLPVMEASSREVHFIEFIAGLDAQVHNGEAHLKERLQTIPDGWRQYRIAKSAINKVINGLYDTLPDKTLAHMTDLIARGEVIIRPKPVCKDMGNVQIVQTADLKLLINHAMAAECAMCMKEGREQKKCELRKALMCICPPTQLNRNSTLCPYIDVANACDIGHYI